MMPSGHTCGVGVGSLPCYSCPFGLAACPGGVSKMLALSHGGAVCVLACTQSLSIMSSTHSLFFVLRFPRSLCITVFATDQQTSTSCMRTDGVVVHGTNRAWLHSRNHIDTTTGNSCRAMTAYISPIPPTNNGMHVHVARVSLT